jgi:hypothetical protein
MGQETLRLEQIKILPQLQPRANLSTERVAQYAEALESGESFPPLVCWTDGKTIWLSQGFHRSAACAAVGQEEVEAIVHKGTFQDAQWDAAGSNVEHDKTGIPRRPGDKRRAIEIALEARPKASNCEIANQVSVAESWVRTIRNSIFAHSEDAHSAREVQRNGKSYTMDVSGIGKGKGKNKQAHPDHEHIETPEAQPGQQIPEEMLVWLSERFRETYQMFIRRFFSQAKMESFRAGFDRFAETEV